MHASIEFAQYKAQLIKDRAPFLNKKGALILDVGCGTGDLTFYLQAVFFDASVAGIDVDRQILDQARATYPSIEFKRMMQQKIPYADNAVDCVILSLILHHLSLEEQSQIIAQARRVVKPSGKIIVLEFNPWNRAMRSQFALDPDERGAQMVSVLTVMRLFKQNPEKRYHLISRFWFIEDYFFWVPYGVLYSLIFTR